MWKTDLRSKAEAYAKRRGLQLLDPPLGDGTEGNVWAARSKQKGGRRAIKIHRHRAAYERERDVYKRLAEDRVFEVLKFSVPQLIHFDDDFLAIEMTIVTRPYVLDFAAAFLDCPPDFSSEVWAVAEAQWQNDFGDQWPQVLAIKDAFEALGIYLIDLHRNNIAL